LFSLKQQHSCTVQQPIMPRDRHTLLSVNVEDLVTIEAADGGGINQGSGLSAVVEDLRVLLQLHACQQVLAASFMRYCYIQSQHFNHTF
jgi:hypothetical protein